MTREVVDVNRKHGLAMTVETDSMQAPQYVELTPAMLKAWDEWKNRSVVPRVYLKQMHFVCRTVGVGLTVQRNHDAPVDGWESPS